MIRHYIKIVALTSYCFLGVVLASAQSDAESFKRTITERDSAFWLAYNQCDVAGMGKYLAKDLEFYHDKGGPTFGLDNLLAVTKKNLCAGEDFRLRREAVKGTVMIYPLSANGKIYGAIISGQHLFYVLEKGKPEKLDGLAKFTHVWLMRDNEWKTARILSYDHGPAK